MKRLIICVCVTLLSVSHVSMADMSPWQLSAHNEANNIKVFTRTLDDSDLKEFKAVTYIKADVSAFVALLKDRPQASSWMHNVIEFELTEQISEQEAIIYTVNQAPWPVTNRDAYLRTTMTADAKGVVTLSVKTETNYGDVKQDYVRMPSVSGQWIFTPQAHGQVKVVYQVHANPGGALPDWLINTIVIESPMKTLTNLHEKIHEEPYQNKRYAFIENARRPIALVAE